MKRKILAWVGILSLTASNAFGWGWGPGGGGGGGNDDTLSSYTVATLPTPVAGLMVRVTDGADSTDCDTGSGSTKVVCIGNGSAFVSVGVAGSSTTSDDAYDVDTWNGDTTNSPSQNAVSDKIEAIVATIIPAATFNAHTILYATTDNTPAALEVTQQTVVGRATGGNIAALAIDSDLASVSASDDTVPSAKAVKAVTDTLVTKALYGAQSVLAATADDTPGAITITESTLVGRAPSGNVAAIGLAAGLTITEAGNLTIGTLNQNTTGTAANVSGTPALPDGTTATKQAKSDNSSKLATTSFVMSQTNTATSAGIVATGAGQVNKVWKTDADGVPGWADDATGGTPTFDTIGNGTNVTATMTVGAGATLTYSTTGIVNASRFQGVTAVDATEFGYLDGVTSAIQTQLGTKAPSTSPTLVTPTLGVATATSINKVALTAPATAATLTIADGKTLTASNTLTLAGTDSTTMTFPTTNATIARTDAANTFTGHQTIEGVTSTGATGTGAFVFATSPTLVTPTIGVATATSVNKVAITAPATSATLTVANGKTLTASNTLTLTATDGSTLAVGTGGTLGTAAYTAATAYEAANAALTSISGLSEAAGGMPYFTAANTWAALAGGASGNVMRYGASTAPTWSTLTMPDTIAAGSVFAANSANVLAAINSTSGTKFLQNVDGTISWATGVGTIAGSTGSADNALITANGTGGVTIQANASTSTLSDAGLLTVQTISSGAGGFTVDATGNTVVKSLTATKVSGTAGSVRLKEANSTDADTAGFRGPLSMTDNTSYEGMFPNAAPTSNNTVLAWTGSAATGGAGTPADPYYYTMSFVDLDLYATLAGGATFTGKVAVPASTSSANGINIGQGAACASAGTNGDLCITASGLYAWIAGGSVGPFSTGAPAFSAVTAGENTNALTIGNSGSLTTTGTGYLSAGGVILGDASPDASGEIGYATNAFNLFANSEDMVWTASANLWTASSATSATFAFTPSVSFSAGVAIPTGQAVAVAGTGYISGGADAADSGFIRMSNNTALAWEAATPGTDVFIALDGSDILQVGQNAANIYLGTSGTGNVQVTGDVTVVGAGIQLGATGVNISSDNDGAITFLGSSAGSDEDLTLNLDDTADTAVISTSTGVTSVNFSALNLVSTGTIQAGIKISSDADGMDAAAMTAAGMYGTLFISTGAGTWILPTAVAGMSACLMSSGSAADLILDTTAGDTLRLKGTEGGDGKGATNAAAKAAGDMICVVAVAANKWSTMGLGGAWVAQP